jgi:hypothetical protein
VDLVCNLDVSCNELLSFLWQLSAPHSTLDSALIETVLIAPGLKAAEVAKATRFVRRGDIASAEKFLPRAKNDVVWILFANQIMWCSDRDKQQSTDILGLLEWMAAHQAKNGFFSFASGVVAMNFENMVKRRRIYPRRRLAATTNP